MYFNNGKLSDAILKSGNFLGISQPVTFHDNYNESVAPSALDRLGHNVLRFPVVDCCGCFFKKMAMLANIANGMKFCCHDSLLKLIYDLGYC